MIKDGSLLTVDHQIDGFGSSGSGILSLLGKSAHYSSNWAVG